MRKYYLIPIAFLILISTTVIGQDNSAEIRQPELDSGSIEDQFDYILTKSTGYKEFQLIRKTSLLKVKNHALDSLKDIQKELISTRQATIKFKSRIINLEKKVENLKDEIAIISRDKDGIQFFGVNISKSSYNLLVWGIIVVLVVMLIAVFLKFINNQSLLKTNKSEITKIEDEFESYRKNSLRKEQEIMRKLQDEINKNSF